MGFSQPVEQNGISYFGSDTGYEYAVYASNGTVLWKTFLGQTPGIKGCSGPLGVTSTATIAGSNLYVDGGNSSFFDLNSSTGAIRWQAPIGNGPYTEGFYDWSSPLVYDGNAYVGIASVCDKPLVQAGVDEFSLTAQELSRYFDSSAPTPNGSSIWGSAAVNPATNMIYVTTGNQYHGTPPTNYSESILGLNATTLAVEASWQVPFKQAHGDSDFGVTPTLFTLPGGVPHVNRAEQERILVRPLSVQPDSCMEEANLLPRQLPGRTYFNGLGRKLHLRGEREHND